MFIRRVNPFKTKSAKLLRCKDCKGIAFLPHILYIQRFDKEQNEWRHTS